MSITSTRGALLALSAAAFGLASASPAFAQAPQPTTPPAPVPAPAAANTYEQITRGNGAAGITKLEYLRTTIPGFVSDLGITAAYTEIPSDFDFARKGTRDTYLRNTLTNQSRLAPASAGELMSVDRFEQTGLWRRTEVVSEFERKVVWAVGRLDGTNLRDLDIQSEFGGDRVLLSGNGRYVVASDRLGLRRFDLQTGTWTQLAPYGYIGKYGVSDDGQTIAAIDFDQEAQRIDAVLYKGTKKIVLVQGARFDGNASEPKISPDGSTAFTVSPAGDYPERTTITAHRVGTSAKWTTTVPFEQTWNARTLWISPSGDRIAWALGWQDPDLPAGEPAQVWKVGQKKWTTFGGAFAGGLRTEDNTYQGSVVSRNGLFATVGYNGKVAVASLTGLPLLGNVLGRESLSASSYIHTPGIDYCGFGFSPYFGATFTRPAPWAPAPRSAKITVKNGDAVLADEAWTRPANGPGASSTGEEDSLGVYFPLFGEYVRNVSLSVVDGYGRAVSESFSKPVTCATAPPEEPAPTEPAPTEPAPGEPAPVEPTPVAGT